MPTRTSLTHPLEIDAMPCGGGLLGMTLCPGKHVSKSNTGDPWERDLALDVRVIADWGATTLVSLMEEHELAEFGVPELGGVAEEAGLEWHFLPIRDVGIPDERFERLWTYTGHLLRRKLESGEKVVLHCRGGYGRTGTIAARLAIECGLAPEDALRRVREARPGTVETREQKAYVLRQRAVETDGLYADRVLGCLLGGAVGDALGYKVEFHSLREIRERFGPTGIQQPVLNSAGKAAVSDDTQMTLFTAVGLVEGMARNDSTMADALGSVRAATLDWYAMQMGRQTGSRLADFALLGENRARGETCSSGCALGAIGTPEKPINEHKKTCGGVMRVAPVGLWLALSDAEAFELAARCAAQTHGHPTGYLSAGAFASMVRNLLAGLEPARCADRSVEIARGWPHADETVAAIESACELADRRIADHTRAVAQLGGGWDGDEALAIGLYSVLVASDFADAVRVASNHGGDSDSTGSIAGQLHGAWKGLAGIPHAWISSLDAVEPIVDVAGRTISAHGRVNPHLSRLRPSRAGRPRERSPLGPSHQTGFR